MCLMSKSNSNDRLNPKKCDVACRHVLMEMNYPRTKWDVESFLWYLYHEGCEVFIDEYHDWYLAVRGKCIQLMANEKCAVERRQPVICAEFSDYEAKKISDLALYRFKTEKQLLKYFKEERPALFKKLMPKIRAATGN